jgi:hypothetical protein
MAGSNMQRKYGDQPPSETHLTYRTESMLAPLLYVTRTVGNHSWAKTSVQTPRHRRHPVMSARPKDLRAGEPVSALLTLWLTTPNSSLMSTAHISIPPLATTLTPLKSTSTPNALQHPHCPSRTTSTGARPRNQRAKAVRRTRYCVLFFFSHPESI